MSEKTKLILAACALVVLWVAGLVLALMVPNLITALCAVINSVWLGKGMADIIGMWQIEVRRQRRMER